RAYRRVYWTGAAFFLRVDTRLRHETGGRASLDSTLAAFHECCMQRGRRWSARELVERFGQLSVPEIWQQEYRATIDSLAEPVYQEALKRLGIVESASGARFSDDADQALLREQMAGPPVDNPKPPLQNSNAAALSPP
ncbi:MAG: hypothetical protein LC637_04530, partial [Xanthomonadaceae bacterium]|nr:hypothetical protein [Xanthomonadaceae bacterium]